MIRLLVAASIRSRGLVLAIGAGLILFGILQFRYMPRDVLPEFGPPTVEVQTEALGLSAQEVEQLVTVPLEQDLLNGVAYLDTIRSESVPGLSQIELIFERGTPLARARQVVNERLTQAFALPAVSSPPQMLQPRSATSRVMMLRVSSEDRSLLELGILARWTLRPHLMGIDGVANVSVWGQREQQLQVQVDPAELQKEGITLDEVISTTGNALWVSPLTFLPSSTPGAGGFYDTASQRIGVEHAQPITNPDALSKVIIEEGTAAPGAAPQPPTRLGDIAEVVEDHQPLIGDAVFTDGGEGLLIVVEKLPEANTLAVTERLDDAIKGLEPGLEGVTVDTGFFRPADYVEDSAGGLRNSLIYGAVLALVALGLLVFQFRTALVTVASVAVAMFAAIAFVALRGETLNVMVLAGLVLALVVVVDDAVNGAFNTARTVDRADDNGESLPSRFGTGALTGARPLAYATVILLLGIAPFLVLTGEGRAFVPPVLLTYAAAAVISFIVALTVAPALSMIVLYKSARQNRQSPAIRWAQPRYERVVNRIRQRPPVALAVLGAVLVVGLVAFPFVKRGSSVVPELKDGDVLVHLAAAPGTSLTEMRRISARVGEELTKLENVDHVGGHVGRAILGDQAVNVNSSELWVKIEDDNYNEAVRAIEDVVHGYPGIDASVTTYGRDRIRSVLDTAEGVAGKDLTVRTFGYRQDELARQATAVQDAVTKIKGVKDPVLQLPIVQPTLEVEVDLDKAQALGVKPGDVRRAAATLISGLVVGNLFEDQKVFEVMVRGTEDVRNSLTSVQSLLINPPSGGAPVRLDSVANVQIVPSPTVIRHDSVSRYVDLGFDTGGRDVAAVAKDVKKALLGLNHPIEYHAELLTDYKETSSSRLKVALAGVLAAIGILLLLQAASGSWRMAPALLLMLVATLGGGLAVAAIAGERVTVGLLGGLVAVGGLAVRQAIVFVHRCHAFEDAGARGPDAVVDRAIAERFAPTVTATAMVIGLMLPLAVFSGRVGHEIVGPMALVVLGGVVTAAVLVLFALPALYERFGVRSEESRERIELFTDVPPAESPPPEEPVLGKRVVDAPTPDSNPVDTEA